MTNNCMFSLGFYVLNNMLFKLSMFIYVTISLNQSNITVVYPKNVSEIVNTTTTTITPTKHLSRNILPNPKLSL